MAIQSAPRTYHSVAVLMSDGRVYSGGGGLCTQNTPPCAALLALAHARCWPHAACLPLAIQLASAWLPGFADVSELECMNMHAV